MRFLERAADLKHHAGQISFPGGRMEDGDADIVAASPASVYRVLKAGGTSERWNRAESRKCQILRF